MTPKYITTTEYKRLPRFAGCPTDMPVGTMYVTRWFEKEPVEGFSVYLSVVTEMLCMDGKFRKAAFHSYAIIRNKQDDRVII